MYDGISTIPEAERTIKWDFRRFLSRSVCLREPEQTGVDSPV